MTTTVSVIALLVVGSLIGVETGVAAFLNPILGRLPDNVGVTGRADAARVLGRVMPFWYSAAIVLTALCWVVDRHGSGEALTVVATVVLVLSLVLSVLFLVPINNRTKTWTPRNAPEDWARQAARWDRLHLVRVAVIVAGFLLLAAGVLTSR